MVRLLFFCGVGLLLSGVTTDVLAENRYDTLAQRKSAKARKKSVKRKAHSKRIASSNKLSPFILRVLYPPSYRFYTKKTRDEIDATKDRGATLKLAQFFPIAAGIEGEFAFNNRFSLAVGGSFSWQDNFYTIEIGDLDREQAQKLKEAQVKNDTSYYEFTISSALYVNANQFKLGLGIGLTFANITMDASGIEDEKKVEYSGKISYKKVSALLSLRRDFFSTGGYGFGIGLTAAYYLTDAFSARLETTQCVEGSDCETKTYDDADDDADDDAPGFYQAVLMPMIYLAF